MARELAGQPWKHGDVRRRLAASRLVALSRRYDAASANANVNVNALIESEMASQGVSVTSSRVTALSAETVVTTVGDAEGTAAVTDALSEASVGAALAEQLPTLKVEIATLVLAPPSLPPSPLPPPPSPPPAPISPPGEPSAPPLAPLAPVSATAVVLILLTCVVVVADVALIVWWRRRRSRRRRRRALAEGMKRAGLQTASSAMTSVAPASRSAHTRERSRGSFSQAGASSRGWTSGAGVRSRPAHPPSPRACASAGRPSTSRLSTGRPSTVHRVRLLSRGSDGSKRLEVVGDSESAAAAPG